MQIILRFIKIPICIGKRLKRLKSSFILIKTEGRWSEKVKQITLENLDHRVQNLDKSFVLNPSLNVKFSGKQIPNLYNSFSFLFRLIGF